MAKRKNKLDTAVEHALYEKAAGATVCQQESYKCKHVEYNDAGKKVREYETVEVREVEKYLAPEMAAISMWLKARLPQVWGESAAPCAEPVRIVDDVPCTAVLLTADGSVMPQNKMLRQGGTEVDNGGAAYREKQKSAPPVQTPGFAAPLAQYGQTPQRPGVPAE